MLQHCRPSDPHPKLLGILASEASAGAARHFGTMRLQPGNALEGPFICQVAGLSTCHVSAGIRGVPAQEAIACKAGTLLRNRPVLHGFAWPQSPTMAWQNLPRNTGARARMFRITGALAAHASAMAIQVRLWHNIAFNTI